MKLKVCGMGQNTFEVSQLEPDYLGFIFWEGSSRNFMQENSTIERGTPSKIGVFVDADLPFILKTVQAHELAGVQLHGNESPLYCQDLKQQLHAAGFNTLIIKAFAIGQGFDFMNLQPYEKVCDFFLFDTKGPLPGGNGFTFDWKILEDYPFEKPFFLSGGIGPGELDKIIAFTASDAATFCYAIDVNSRFEVQPGLKDIPALSEFILELKKKNVLSE